ncbi:MAG TPA: aminotransferase class I/II-fold pyridoxal phosphate-dependent enzyme [Nocardioides sp.]|uniref:aminotransferase class I/II-fold pyridoxal phosphate-dependent enzyme n=1 Tax=Nocardioides sp. TaxID=35761 RepID=UPI002E31E6FB|nr:aminotransferase class I/II-fold pyridoxal phosphate-dependent enzyme [Nocardioides sp.]HEX3929600.1 aminotransferase class I/II-fold pyridoxal phosphate-dependent enzyme [Nocardioides sp.]
MQPDPDLLDDAPLLHAWVQARRRLGSGRLRPFTTPGHKQRTDLVGDLVTGDLPLYGGLAPVREADALVRSAEARTAGRYGADWCRYSVGGSTHGNQTMALAVGVPGETVVVDRTCHRSVLLGLVLAGLRPVWLHPPVDPTTGLPLGIQADAVAAALESHPEARAVFVTSPSYVATCADIGAIARVTRAARVPLVVDAAWGAHLGSHPALPPHPFAAGADAVVTSAHKTLPALNHGAVVLARTDLLDAGRLDRAADATATTSPSGAILAGVDAAMALLAIRGEELVAALLTRVRRAREALAGVPGLVAPDSATFGEVRFDDAKLVVLTAATGAYGLAVDRDLAAAGFALEMADRDLLVPMVTLADDDAAVEDLVRAMAAAVLRHRGRPRQAAANAAWTVDTEQVLTPREAFFAPREPVPWSAAVGRVCAEVVAPYPPGVAVLAPGERITEATLAALHRARDDGARIAYAADPSLATVLAVRKPSAVGGRP